MNYLITYDIKSNKKGKKSPISLMAMDYASISQSMNAN